MALVGVFNINDRYYRFVVSKPKDLATVIDRVVPGGATLRLVRRSDNNWTLAIVQLDKSKIQKLGLVSYNAPLYKGVGSNINYKWLPDYILESQVYVNGEYSEGMFPLDTSLPTEFPIDDQMKPQLATNGTNAWTVTPVPETDYYYPSTDPSLRLCVYRIDIPKLLAKDASGNPTNSGIFAFIGLRSSVDAGTGYVTDLNFKKVELYSADTYRLEFGKSYYVVAEPTSGDRGFTVNWGRRAVYFGNRSANEGIKVSYPIENFSDYKNGDFIDFSTWGVWGNTSRQGFIPNVALMTYTFTTTKNELTRFVGGGWTGALNRITLEDGVTLAESIVLAGQTWYYLKAGVTYHAGFDYGGDRYTEAAQNYITGVRKYVTTWRDPENDMDLKRRSSIWDFRNAAQRSRAYPAMNATQRALGYKGNSVPINLLDVEYSMVVGNGNVYPLYINLYRVEDVERFNKTGESIEPIGQFSGGDWRQNPIPLKWTTPLKAITGNDTMKDGQTLQLSVAEGKIPPGRYYVEVLYRNDTFPSVIVRPTTAQATYTPATRVPGSEAYNSTITTPDRSLTIPVRIDSIKSFKE